MMNLYRYSKLGVMLLASTIVAFTSGCASGGFKLTREYAGFVNRQHVVIRVILYILTSVIFFATLLIDLVLNNTMDFWDGRVSQGTYTFSTEDKTFVVQHDISSEGLKSSHIEVFAKDKAKLQDVTLKQTAQLDIEVFVDGQLKGRVSDIHAVPRLSVFNSRGERTENRALWPAGEMVAVK